MSGKPDVDTLFLNDSLKQEPLALKQSAPKDTQALLTSKAIEVLTFLNKKTGRAYRPIDANLKLIIARLKTGVTIADCHQVIAKKNREWRDNPKMAEYLRPATLFNATKFEQYMGELILPEGEQHESR